MEGEPKSRKTWRPRSGRLRIGIAIATANRPEIVRKTVGLISLQRRMADAILICSPGEEDVAGLRDAHPGVVHLIGPRGLPHQRNRLVEAADNLDVLVFLDDDFIMDGNYLAEIEAVFRDCPDVILTTGRVVADGIIGPGLSLEEALKELSAPAAPPDARLAEVYNGYGCNMAIRLQTVRANALRFDEELPLYAWLEDVDFSRCMAPFGRIVRVEHARGVHLGVKSGRQRGVRLGYSQIANPCYLIAKGTCSWRKGFFHICRNLAANLYGTLRGERAVDRPGRLLGNLKAMADLLTQRLAPSRALRL
ncbi:glycosyltransferase family 2 protein [Pararhizobium sp. BT-229]|uniref:glycosyltransferase family 2 protein n=1 Tax=Pararhizobium sp. BT-229 TaxID=2986923 RepID=UPI0021F730E6|nr:glycosyltransferase family 2 protein [Pararhizobium sp. BT-229]MCV9967740.1 glycosyltransferase family 2 protein [Pararhizobium sp. BT-229]